MSPNRVGGDVKSIERSGDRRRRTRAKQKENVMRKRIIFGEEDEWIFKGWEGGGGEDLKVFGVER